MAQTFSASNLILKLLFHISLVVLFVNGHGQSTETEPEFLAPLDNLTVTQGRDISFTCVVNNLGQYRVAWIKSDSKAILAIHTHMVALNPRLSVTHNGHNTWKLHISHVQLNDSGSYMCQVNTDPMRSQSGNLDVVVPPDILNSPDLDGMTMEEGITNEGGAIQLVCQATGVPEPTVQWRREGSREIFIRNEGRDKQIVKHVDGERLVLNQVQRSDMGGYLCIASNGVPPSVSKRFDVQVNFAPSVKPSTQLLGAPVESNVLLQCIVEAFPKPLNSWLKSDATSGTKLYHGEKYTISEISISNSYTWQMNLTVKNVQKNDFGAYLCVSENAFGKSDSRIRLQELYLPPKPTTTQLPLVYTTVKPPRRKHHQQSHNVKATNDVLRPKEPAANNFIPDNEFVVPPSEAVTQLPAKQGIDKQRNTPPAQPSRRPPWVLHSGNNRLECTLFYLVTTSALFLFNSKLL